jgi:hypothetical protein
MKHFRISFLVTFVCLVAAGWWGYHNAGLGGAMTALGIAIILGVMEVSLSFDNAVVNASVLKNWNEFWKKLFLGLGIIIAVFGMRLVFPLVIVAVAADLGMAEVWNLALTNPNEFSRHLTDHHAEVAAFGGMFLLLVFLNFLLDDEKELHWLGNLERKISTLGRVSSISVLVALGTLIASLSMIPPEQEMVVLMAGLWGILIYIGVDMISSLLEKQEAEGGDVVRDYLGRRHHHAGPRNRRHVRAFDDRLPGRQGHARQIRLPRTRRALRDRHPGSDHAGEYEVPHPRDLHGPDRRRIHPGVPVVIDPPQEKAWRGFRDLIPNDVPT